MSRYIDADLIPYSVMRNLEDEQVAITDKRRVDKVPTADVKPVRHGHWVFNDRDGYAFCTACKTKMNPYVYGYGYCPMCGARMDGKEMEQ